MRENEKFLAHRSEDGREQSIEEHLEGTGKLCAAFAKAFCAEEQGRFLGQLHDIGKFSYAFQKRLYGGPKVDHATAGAIESARANATWGAFCIAGHHSGIPNGGNIKTDAVGDHTLFGRLKNGLAGGIPEYRSNWPGLTHFVKSLPEMGKSALSDSFFIRMLYSCLVDADYLDTEDFMNNGISMRGTYSSVSELLKRLNAYIAPWWTPKNELNRQRCSILKNCIAASTQDKGLYSLTVPTGGGKTVASMAFALHHAHEHGMSRIIYVIPYTSIIEQNAEIFREIFGKENVVEHHSGITYEIEENSDSGAYKMALATENWDAPIIVTTAVQFFESLYSNRPSKCRKLHNIANSVIVFDEAQILPTAHLRPCVAAISNLVKNFGATAVLCTATQPYLNDLFEEYADGMKITEICTNTEELYQHLRRVTFRSVGRLSSEMLAAELCEQKQVLCIVNTRKEAQALYSLLPKDGSFHLSTLMYPAHRRSVLSEVKKRLVAGLPCRVISTSLIEAGVDIDFPAVYRELSGLDSILQAAGRCNREGTHKPSESIVTVFEGETPAPPMIKINIGAAVEALSSGGKPDDPQTIARYFSSYRSLAGKSLDKSGIVDAFDHGIAGCSMPFETVAERFHLIDNATKAVYIPIDVGESLIRQIRYGKPSRELYRNAGQYCVNIFEQHYNELVSAGDIEPLNADSAVLINMDLYNGDTGLSLKADSGKGQFI